MAQIKNYTNWKIFNSASYLAETHGGRYLNNYANAVAASTYGQYDKVEKMPVGSVLVKDGIAVNATGQTGVSPLFVMEKMKAGFEPSAGDWRYTMIMPNGTVVGTTKGKGSASVKFCAACHAAGADNDFLLFLPEELRIQG
ncbi:MAG: cytochrome P460 family protein [Rhodospirillales bacterium]|nr:cytochrome P460 family protein [Rhodospirillales bacterium]